MIKLQVDKKMNKKEFVAYIAEKHGGSQKKATEVINIFTDSITKALSEGNEISLIGFGNFSVQKVEARKGNNPRTQEKIDIPAYNQVRFKVGTVLKKACNQLKYVYYSPYG